MEHFDEAVELLREERKHQTEKWGVQEHSTFVWMNILMEEVGEAAQACLHDAFGGEAAGTFQIEIVHVCAVAIQIIESLLTDKDRAAILTNHISTGEKMNKLLKVSVPQLRFIWHLGFTSGRVREAAHRNKGCIWDDETPLWLDDIKRIASADKPLRKEIESVIRKDSEG